MPFFLHMLDFKNTFNFSQATLIKPIPCWNSSLFESVIISHSNNAIKQCPGFLHISLCQANIILQENNIEIDNG